jgi:C-terminal processing protease CtpA/Prc
VLDLRDNGGGEDALGKLLFSYLVDQPFQYYDELTLKRDKYSFAKYAEEAPPRLKPSSIRARPDGQFDYLKHPNLGLQQPSLPTFQGRVFILMNGGSFSTTAEFLTQAHSHQRATFIGEESGGGYFGNTSGNHMILQLPNTKTRLVVPLLTYYENTLRPHAKDRGVFPDYPVQRTIDDYLKGRDPEWELALKLARKPQLNTAK